MILTGFNTRSIADQNNVIGFNFNVAIPTTAIPLSFGLSGSNVFKFHLNNGKIYDNNSNFVESYSANVPIVISGQLGQSSFDYSIYSILVGQQCKIASGLYNCIFFDNPSNMAANFDAIISGASPNYFFSQTGYYFGQNITGLIENLTTGLNFRIFDIQIANTGAIFSINSFTASNINNNSPGQFTISSNTGNFVSTSVPLNFFTNFGLISQRFFISGNGIPIDNNYLTVAPPNNTGISNFNASNFISYFSDGFNPSIMNVSLSYLSGVTGQIFKTVPSGNPISSVGFSGSITGCGQFSGQYTGNITGIDPILGSHVTGAGAGIFSNNFCATGQVTLPYYLLATGVVNTGDNTPTAATGYISGTLTGIVSSGSGFYQFGQFVSGSVASGFTDSIGFYQATGFLNYINPQSGDSVTFNNTTYSYVPSGADLFSTFSTFQQLSGMVNTGFFFVGIKFTGISSGVNLQVDPSFAQGENGNGLVLTGSNTGMFFTNPLTTGGFNFNISGVPSGLFTGYVDGEVFAIQNVTGYLTGQLTGYLTILDYVRTFSGLWDLTTGTIDYRQSGYIGGPSNTIYSHSSVSFPSPNSLAISVNYNNQFSYTPSMDLAILTITGNFGSGVSYLLSGSF